MAMSSSKRKVLQENFTKITENIADADSVVSHLLSAGVITQCMEEEIMSKPTKRNKIREVLTLLPKRGEAAFDRFYKVLIDSEELIVAKLLEPHVTDRSLIPNNVPYSVGNLTVDVDQLPEVFPPSNAEEIKLKLCLDRDTDMAQIYRKSLDVNNSEVYKNTKGLCLLFYNSYFDDETGMTELNWDADVQGLSSLFEELKFRVENHGFTIPGIKKILNKYRENTMKDINMKDIDCLVVFVMTHGERGLIYGTDGNSMTVQSIIDYFYPTSCPDLGSKPKLFFIQAPSIVRETVVDSVDGVPEQKDISIKTAVDQLKLGSSEEPDAVAEPNMPSRGNTFVCISATSGNFKPKASDSGSMFIQTLIYAYKIFSCSSHLFSLTQKMNKLIKIGEVKNGYQASGGSYFKSSLNKLLYFFPGKSQ